MRFFVISLLGAALACAPAWSETPAPFPDFKAKRVKPPAAGTKKRITIQIDPTEVAVVAPKPPATPKAPRAANGSYDWFWEKISPDLAQAGPGRLDDAMAAISAGGVAAPRLQQMQGIAQAQGVEILKSTIGTRVSPALVLAVMTVESAGKTDAVSRAGAQGLMQLMPDTAARFGVANSLVAADNIRGGVQYLDWLMGKFDHDPILVLAGYNAGEGSVQTHAGVPPFAETRDYVPKVLAAFQVARGLCLTPPQLISDGCVFAAMN
ncbi:lytic transglycosylase domain-containing protein [Pseudosulfitobacter pseudonitzschiae]|uniref:lytic transglycosylase domain-containing protein n=1 Tax=Pseudosulfitobacter pseudonitzschiae TaxID=1402135 RepID=UPI001AF0F10C|nr:lytic transglycosylase domain-containing protein [Pseudosulfitobacter pseudonitzschiae]MBM1815177.1 lytic transglycosylase domain-containing protein [Pseudosulfitobacter pseudonitzschiae]MBM1832168.1 lytic transglycosylase domain-containing protein [Pseudosulfitobacter pseudonitzschiae]MBM1837036.1 lytic transglycosylase domain-containing protein [Pseudosulfitobacter pseudonitzschiae]MBM1841882.1 lytic transglycosylase domain-containing protein [Pseudosulfitobacter pseudonitzschiae]MBM18467